MHILQLVVFQQYNLLYSASVKSKTPFTFEQKYASFVHSCGDEHGEKSIFIMHYVMQYNA